MICHAISSVSVFGDEWLSFSYGGVLFRLALFLFLLRGSVVWLLTSLVGAGCRLRLAPDRSDDWSLWGNPVVGRKRPTGCVVFVGDSSVELKRMSNILTRRWDEVLPVDEQRYEVRIKRKPVYFQLWPLLPSSLPFFSLPSPSKLLEGGAFSRR